jgi:hypothetical protein
MFPSLQPTEPYEYRKLYTALLFSYRLKQPTLTRVLEVK